MTSNSPNEPEARASDTGTTTAHDGGRPFLTVVAPWPLGPASPAPEDGALAPLRDLLRGTRTLILVGSGDPPGAGDLADLQALLGGHLVLLPSGPPDTSPVSHPQVWFEAGLRTPGLRTDTVARETALWLAADLSVSVPAPDSGGGLERLCDLRTDDFVSAWNRRVTAHAPRASAARVRDVVPGDAPLAAAERNEGCRRCVELEDQVRELAHERAVLRTNRDSAREEHLAELREHRALGERTREELEAYERELEARAAILDDLRSSRAEQERELARYREHVENLEFVLRRTRAHKIRKWLDRWDRLRGRRGPRSDGSAPGPR